MQFDVTVWNRDWEHLAHAEDLTEGELLEYLRWLACNRPRKYAAVMTSFMDAHERGAISAAR